MRSYWYWLVATALGFTAATAAHFYFAVVAEGYPPGGPYFTPWAAFMDADFVTQQGIIGLVMMAFWLVVIAWLGGRELAKGKPRTEAEIVLRFAAALAAAYGLAIAIYGEGMTRMAAAATHTTNPAILAPSRAEGMLAIAAGFLAAAVAVAGAAFLSGRSAGQSPEP